MTSPSCFLSIRSKSVGKLSQYLKHMRQPWQSSKPRVTSAWSASLSQYFGCSGSYDSPSVGWYEIGLSEGVLMSLWECEAFRTRRGRGGLAEATRGAGGEATS